MTLPSALPPTLSVREAAVYASCKTVSACRDWVRKAIMPEGTAVPAEPARREADYQTGCK
jgi:hypothetical protein